MQFIFYMINMNLSKSMKKILVDSKMRINVVGLLNYDEYDAQGKREIYSYAAQRLVCP